jgi:hypothetical protein
MRAAKAMHSDLKEELSSLNIVIEDISDKSLSSYYHFLCLSVNIFAKLLYHIGREKSIYI